MILEFKIKVMSYSRHCLNMFVICVCVVGPGPGLLISFVLNDTTDVFIEVLFFLKMFGEVRRSFFRSVFTPGAAVHS